MSTARALVIRQHARTADKDRTFFEALEGGYSLSRACAYAGYQRGDIAEWRRQDRTFDLAIEGAIQHGTEHLEDEARDMAFRGYTVAARTVSTKGGVSESIMERRSEGLAKFLLEARDPARFKPRNHVVHTGENGAPIGVAAAVAHVHVGGMSDEELARRLVALLAGVPPEKLAETLDSLAGQPPAQTEAAPE